MNIGDRVRTNREFSGIPVGSEGIIVEDYGSGLTVAWDLPDKPYPNDLMPQQVAQLWAVNPICPIRDGFDKETELHYLELVAIDITPEPNKLT